jgi:hypothetical protein
MTYWFFHIPGLTRSRINDQLHVIPDPDQGSRLSRDTFGLALPAVYFCFGKKKQKPWAAIIIPPIRCTDDSARAARLAAGIHRQIQIRTN